jgi:hypothetical protein
VDLTGSAVDQPEINAQGTLTIRGKSGFTRCHITPSTLSPSSTPHVAHLQHCQCSPYSTATAGEPKPVDSGISPSTRAIKARKQVDCAVNTVRDVSAPKRDTPGDVRDDFSLADTFLAQPPPLVSIDRCAIRKRTELYVPLSFLIST